MTGGDGEATDPSALVRDLAAAEPAHEPTSPANRRRVWAVGAALLVSSVMVVVGTVAERRQPRPATTLEECVDDVSCADLEGDYDHDYDSEEYVEDPPTSPPGSLAPNSSPDPLVTCRDSFGNLVRQQRSRCVGGGTSTQGNPSDMVHCRNRYGQAVYTQRRDCAE